MNFLRIQTLIILALWFFTISVSAEDSAVIQDSLSQIRIATLIPSPSAMTLDIVKEHVAILEKNGATKEQLIEVYLIQSQIANKLGLTEESKSFIQKAYDIKTKGN